MATGLFQKEGQLFLDMKHCLLFLVHSQWLHCEAHFFLVGISRKQNGSDLGKKCEGVAWKECLPNSEAEVNRQEHERLFLCKDLPST